MDSTTFFFFLSLLTFSKEKEIHSLSHFFGTSSSKINLNKNECDYVFEHFCIKIFYNRFALLSSVYSYLLYHEMCVDQEVQILP